MGIYQNCYELVAQYIYGGVELTAEMQLVATEISTIASVALFALPFILVIWLVKLVAWGCSR